MNSFFFFEETILSSSVWQRSTNRKAGDPLPLSRVINDLVRDEYLRLYNSPSSRMLFPEKAVQVADCPLPPPSRAPPFAPHSRGRWMMKNLRKKLHISTTARRSRKS